MFKLLNFLIFASLLIFTEMSAVIKYQKELDYEIQTIDLILQVEQTHPIALNNNGEILGWYKIKKLDSQKHFFIRATDGNIQELPNSEKAGDVNINWKFLTNNGHVYGTFDGNPGSAVLYMWEPHNGVVKLGDLPGKEITAVNDAGQVLIKSIEYCENGICGKSPVMWDNGKIIRLKGLGNELDEESYGFDMNNQGDVVGQSLYTGTNFNGVFQQVHAVKWSNGIPVDLNSNAHAYGRSSALAINDKGDILVDLDYRNDLGKKCLLKNDGRSFDIEKRMTKLNNSGKLYCEGSIRDERVSPAEFYATLFTYLFNMNANDFSRLGIDKAVKVNETIYFRLDKIVKVNDKNEILCLARTKNYQDHILYLRLKNTTQKP